MRAFAGLTAIGSLAIGAWLVSITLVATGSVEASVLLVGAWLVLHGVGSLAVVRRPRGVDPAPARG